MDPLLLTGDWRSRCPASRSSALGSCAAGLMLGIDRGSQCPARIHAGSSTRTRKERAAFLQEWAFPTASPFASYTARRARGRTVLPRPGSRRDPTARRSPGSGEHGVPGTRGWLLRLPKGSRDPRQAEPRRRRLLPAQGVRGQRGSMLPGRTLSPGCLFKFGEVGPTPSKGAWGFGVNPCQAWLQTPLCGVVPSGQGSARGRGAAGHGTRGAAPRLGTAGSTPRARSARGAPVPTKPRHHRHTVSPQPVCLPKSMCLPSPYVSPVNRGPGRRERTAQQCSPNAPKLVPAATFTDNFCCRSYTDKIGKNNFKTLHSQSKQ